MIEPSSNPARVRFAPSPTGLTHLGSGRTALYNYLLARQTGGQFILRIEDTDQKRYDPESEKDLIDGLHWLGLDWDEGPNKGGPHAPYRQSERKQIYQGYAQKLVDKEHAYPCFCTPQRLAEVRQEQQKRKETTKYDRTCRDIPKEEASERVKNGERHVIRFKMPKDGSITIHDQLRGEIVVENATLDDYILVKSDGLALYHLAAMVDDHLMGITHVFRGSEWLPTFPLHVHIYRAFGWEEPTWVHLSVFLNPTGKGKMSKRFAQEMALKGNSIFIKDLRNLGYLPEAVNNWVALMGWSYDDHTEFFTTDDLVEKFSTEKLSSKPSAINFTKLDHFNGLHIRNLPESELANRVKPYYLEAGYAVDDAILEQIIPLIQVRLKTLDEAPENSGFFFIEDVSPDKDILIGQKMTDEESAAVLVKAKDILERYPDLETGAAEEQLRSLAEECALKPGQVFGILRSAVTGRKVSPPLFESMAVIGNQKVIQRIDNAINILSQ